MDHLSVSRDDESKLQLVLVIHNHQPVGNFGHVIEEACDKAYLPFLLMLREFPQLKLGLHTSGSLWEWLEANRPEYGEVVAELLASGQLELLGGGMYEPILPVLPERDALWQIQRLSGFLNQRFGVEPQGMWCPERVWEPHLPQLMKLAGINYTLLDDFHFRASAAAGDISTEYFATEHAGHIVALLPISQKLRYTMPFKPVGDTFAYLRQLAAASSRKPLVVFGDDGEKFGVWPETYEWVYGKGWLRQFFTELTANLDWIELLLPREAIAARRPASKVFIPCASYAEMGDWTRVDLDAAEDAPTGFWRNYQHKYPESNAMYRRMLLVSDELHKARQECCANGELMPAADDLGRAQCNCAYWHGVFGGLYLNYLRQAVYFHLLRAENELRRLCPQVRREPVTAVDFDGLGWQQYILENKELSAVVDPVHGLCMSRLDYRPTCFCWSDVLARRREKYHAKLLEADNQAAEAHASIHDRVVVKEAGLQARLVIDPHPRISFNTYFSNIEDPQQLMYVQSDASSPQRRFDDYGQALVELVANSVKLSGRINHEHFSLLKQVQINGDNLEFGLRLHSGILPPADDEFIVEFNFTLLTDLAEDRFINVQQVRYSPAEAQAWSSATEIALVDGWQKRQLVLHSAQLKRIMSYPVHTVSSSEGGFERTYQGSCMLLCYHPLALQSGIQIQLAIEEVTAI